MGMAAYYGATCRGCSLSSLLLSKADVIRVESGVLHDLLDLHPS